MFLFFIQNLFGQNPYYYSINKTNGLPHNFVYDIHQGKNSLMWMATNEGLCSYDGYQFTTFNNNQQSSKAGSNIIEDQYGRIWYCNFDGNIYYIEKNKLQVLPIKNPIGFHKFNILKNHLVYLEQNRLVFLDLKTLHKVKNIPFDTRNIQGIHKIEDIIYIIGKSIYEIQSPKSIRKYDCETNFSKIFNGGLITNSKNKLLFISKFSNDYCLFSKGKFEFKKHDNSKVFLQNAIAENDFHWLSSTKGLLKINFNRSDIKTEKYFEHYNISSVCKDKENGYWISTLGEGVLYIPNFNNILYPTIATPTVLEEANGVLYYGTSNDKLVKTTNPKNLNNHHIIYDGQSNHSVVNLTFSASENQFLFTSNTFKCADKNGKVIKEDIYAVKQLERIDNTFYAYAASGNFGLIKLNDQSSYWNKIHQTYKKSELLKMNYSSFFSGIRGKSVAYDNVNKTIYAATNIGLLQYHNKRIKEIRIGKKSIYLLKIYFKDHTLYGLTTNNDLIAIDMVKNRTQWIYNSKIEGDLIQRITLINNSLFLVTSSDCLAYDLTKKSFSSIFNINSDIEVNDILLKKDTLILATSRGIIRLDKTGLTKQNDSKFVLQDILVNNKPVSEKDRINLPFNKNNIEIRYAIIAYPQNINKPIYYSLNDEKWRKMSGNSRSLLLNALSPGNYTVAFKTNPNATQKLEISFHIQKPLWAKGWFLILIIALCLFGISLFYRKRINALQSKNQIALEKAALENSLTQSKIKAIKSQMNPHFFYNALNTLQSYILSNDKKQALEYLSKFSGLTRTILEMTEKDTTSIAEEVKTLSLYLEIEKARFENDFEFEITVDADIDTEQTKIPSMLLQPFVENAVKHGLLHKTGHKKVCLSLKNHTSFIEIEIDDNGIGRKKSAELNQIKNKKHQSFATAAIQNRIDLLNSNLKNKISVCYYDKISPNNQSYGTTVTITIPKNDTV